MGGYAAQSSPAPGTHCQCDRKRRAIPPALARASGSTGSASHRQGVGVAGRFATAATGRAGQAGGSDAQAELASQRGAAVLRGDGPVIRDRTFPSKAAVSPCVEETRNTLACEQGPPHAHARSKGGFPNGITTAGRRRIAYSPDVSYDERFGGSPPPLLRPV
jgi:hypothetical protein